MDWRSYSGACHDSEHRLDISGRARAVRRCADEVSVVEIGPTIDIEWSSGTGSGADSQGRAPANRPPNIVLIVADDMGWNDISMNGAMSQ